MEYQARSMHLDCRRRQEGVGVGWERARGEGIWARGRDLIAGD